MPLAYIDKLEARAVKLASADDFGGDYYREGLEVFLSSCAREFKLGNISFLIRQQSLLKGLVLRLLLTKARKQTPEMFAKPVQPPIIILGMPRTGSTYLHRLLARDPRSLGLPTWQLFRPIPKNAFETEFVRATITRGELFAWRMAGRSFDQIHLNRAHLPDECMFALIMTMNSLFFWTVLPVYDYLDWLGKSDTKHKYDDYRMLMSVFQASAPGQRLVLKSPEHTGAIDDVARVFPDAKFVHIHRDPATAMKSYSSLTYVSQSRLVKSIDSAALVEANVSFFAEQMNRHVAQRASHNVSVCDVHYNQFIADPMAQIERIYRFCDIDIPPYVAKCFTDYISAQRHGAKRPHRYAGLESSPPDGAINERFDKYLSMIGVI